MPEPKKGEYYVVGRHQPVVVTTPQGDIIGYIYIPELKRRLSEILNDERAFLPLTDVTVEDGGKIEYLAINKRFVITVREG
ncbi:MAG: hypothetical protein O7H41_01180 [Planctomycetota bacterium]|nr:hypothetical protein [Planctomycetota bacterium]